MSATQSENKGKWGKRFMMILFIIGVVVSFAQFNFQRARLAEKAHLERELSRSYSRYADQERRNAMMARKSELTRARNDMRRDIRKIRGQADSIVIQSDFEDSFDGLVVREKHISLNEGNYWQPYGALEGGLDTERTLELAAKTLARRIAHDTWSRRREGREIETIAIRGNQNDGDKVANRRLVHRVKKEVEKMTRLWVFDGTAGERAQGYLVADRIHPEHGRIVDVKSDDSKLRASVVIDRKMTEMPVIPGNWARRSEMSFLTYRQRTPEYAREDALDALSSRIKGEIWRLALANGHSEIEDKEEFALVLGDKYTREILVGIGRRSLQPIKIILGDAHDGSDEIYYQTEVVWSGNQNNMIDIADAVSDTIRTRKRVPFVRLGLSLGLCVLALLTWLRVDWWLKGHYSLLSKLSFVILAVCSILAVWNYPIHV